MERKRVAILFFGLTRSLTQTVDSLQKNIFDVLTTHSYDYDIFIHTYKIHGSYKNPWSHEHTSQYMNEDVETLLQPRYILDDNQDEVVQSIDTNLGNWNGEMSSTLGQYLIRNMCLALWSKKKITSLFESIQDSYDYVIILRPDLLIHTRLDITCFDTLTDTNIIIPYIDDFSGVNDRICIAKPNVAIYYGTLFDHLKEYSQQKSIVSEQYLMDKLHDANIQILRTNILYDLLRIPGTTIRTVKNSPQKLSQPFLPKR